MREEPRIIYSLDAFPVSNNRWNQGNKFKETIYSTALSILYSHLWYQDIELYADETAYKFLYMLPCRVTKINSNQDSVIWMKSKIDVIKKQIKPFIHLDNDVFIKKKIHFDFDKVIVEQNDYELHGMYKYRIDFFNQYAQNLDYWKPDLGYAYNCGVLGFRDFELRDQFLNVFYVLEEIFIKNHNPKIAKIEPCIVLEQYNLASLLHYKNIKPTLLLWKRNSFENFQLADKIGYSHIVGQKKYRNDIVEEIENRLSKLFPYWYKEVKNALVEEGID
ncbi:DUF6734 family protein [Flavobacterium hibisci]|uniref:DUF6734 family protein n=1 Tax=Flavobacterium hibisci TaxID=1914462 RepID=UPI001CC055AA|nr:DUF6734 family protein [Flavobacterium hibisci]MBZ4043756.1 hypothetical protein [Flavobacterium hibisci]